ncbi:MAG: Holliday junction resolvase RuvX [Acidobacteria bacterium]|nr:Holliday junction resolvase RuvX [Acidobacteriota bacterium]
MGRPSRERTGTLPQRGWTPRESAPYNGRVKSSGRILAIDLGSKNIGLAVTDALGLGAQGLPTLRRTNRRADLKRLRELVEAIEVERIVVGHPLHLKGYAGARAQQAARFADWLRRELRLPVELFDERLTSWEAEQRLRAAGSRRFGTRAQRKDAVDRLAATLILESYLEHQTARAAREKNPAPAES